MISYYLGFMGSILLALCALPQCIKTYRTKRCDDLSWLFLGMWGFGEIATLLYVYEQHGLDPLLFLNYIANIIMVGYLCGMKKKNK